MPRKPRKSQDQQQPPEPRQNQKEKEQQAPDTPELNPGRAPDANRNPGGTAEEPQP